MVILSNRWLQSSMSDISKLKYAQGISVHFLLSFSLKSTTCIYFVTSKVTGACMHTFTSPNTIRIWRNRILFPLCIWCYLIILYKSLWPFCSGNSEASSWTLLWIQQEFDLCVVETFIVKPAQLYAIICYGKWMINKGLINFIDQQQSW